MAYPNSFGYDPFYRPDPPFDPPASLPDFTEYFYPTNYSFSSYHQMSCHHYQDPNHLSEQRTSIGFSLGLGQKSISHISRTYERALSIKLQFRGLELSSIFMGSIISKFLI